MAPTEPNGDALLRMAAELRADLDDIARVVAETEAALPQLRVREPATLTVYGAGKLVHDFYTGSERMFERVALTFGGVPAGSAWHRQLLDDMALDIPRLRPPVLRGATRDRLGGYLKFRHLFRTLYAFTLQAELVAAQMEAMPAAWRDLRADVEAFAGWLQAVASATGTRA